MRNSTKTPARGGAAVAVALKSRHMASGIVTASCRSGDQARVKVEVQVLPFVSFEMCLYDCMTVCLRSKFSVAVYTDENYLIILLINNKTMNSQCNMCLYAPPVKGLDTTFFFFIFTTF